MHVRLHNLFKVKKVYMRGEEQTKGVWEDVRWGGRISGTKGGLRWECDRALQGEGQDEGMGGWDVLVCRMKKLARKL